MLSEIMSRKQTSTSPQTTKNTEVMQNVPRVLPWQSWGEWSQVCDALFNIDPNHQAAAIRRISTWRIRGRCPHAVSSSAQLVEARINDNNMSTGGISTISDQPLRTCYAMCIVRAVNGIVDGGQKGTQATSIQKLAKKVGLPVWIVELRHDASHNNLPHLPLLRLAVTAILDWFYREYWMAQKKFLSDIRALCQGTIKRFDKNPSISGSDGPLRSSLSAIPNSTLASMFVPLLFEQNENQQQTSESPFMTATGVMSSTSIFGSSGSILTPDSLRYPPTLEGVRLLHVKIKPLFEALQAQWSGFSECFLTQLVDELLILPNTPIGSKINQQEGEVEDIGQSCYDNQTLAKENNSIIRDREFFLISWIRFILSRAWFCHLLADPQYITNSSSPSSSSSSSTDDLNSNHQCDSHDINDELFLKFEQNINSTSSVVTPNNHHQNKKLKRRKGARDDLKNQHLNPSLLNEVVKQISMKSSSSSSNKEYQENFMFDICPASVFVENGLLCQSTFNINNNNSTLLNTTQSTTTTESFLVYGGDNCIPCRLLRLAVWISKNKLTNPYEEGNLMFEGMDCRLHVIRQLLNSPFFQLPSSSSSSSSSSLLLSIHQKVDILNEEISSSISNSKKKKRKLSNDDMVQQTPKNNNGTFNTSQDNELLKNDEVGWELVLDWVPCALGSLPGTGYAPLDVV